ncbi:AraC-type DNA-binding protein [Streptomyces sp. DvalAA-14]|nr:AraC-type DNA-binding protein [Streptomyces sp. DvalAA-14]
MGSMQLGPVTVWPSSLRPARLRWSPRTVPRSAFELYRLTLLLDDGPAPDPSGRAGTFGPRVLHLTDGSRPYRAQARDGRERRAVRAVGVDFPKALLAVPADRVEELLGRPLSGREGVGALLAEFLAGLDRQAATLRPSDAPRVGRVLLDLLSAWFAQLLEAEAGVTQETYQRATVESLLAFIRQNLHDPELTPPAIAAAHHISLSYLHRIFQQQRRGETVAAWIRGQRLEGARRDLADPALRATPIHVIAARWGLPRASDFTRAFRTAYGISPRESRARALSGREE